MTQVVSSEVPLVGVLPSCLSRVPLGRGLMWEDAEIKNTMVQATQGFRQVRAARMRNTLHPVGWCVLP